MRSHRSIYRVFHHPFLIFGATAITLFFGTNAWFAWQTFQQDKALINQRIQERLDNASDLVAAALQEKYLQVEEQLNELANLPGAIPTEVLDHLQNELNDEGLVVILESGKFEAYPRNNLRYYPVRPASLMVEQDLFLLGEYDEFHNQNFNKAAEFYTTLVSSTDHVTHAEALMRLGRVQRKANDLHSALSIYNELAESGIENVDGLPAELMARYARCAIYEELGEDSELLQEAQLIWAGLQQAKWQLTPSEYRFYERKILNWLQPVNLPTKASMDRRNNALILTGAVEELWRVWQSIQQGIVSPSGERNVWINSFPAFVFWRGNQNRVVALVAQSNFLETEWLNPVVQRILETQDVKLTLLDGEGNAILGNWADESTLQAFRTASQAQLPWASQITCLDPDVVIAELKTRQRFYMAWLATMIILVLVASYATLRSVSKELSVARLKGEFVSAVSHEFRTPLSTLCHLSDSLVEDRVASQDLRIEYYKAMKRESERLRRMVVGLLDFRRMEEGAYEYRKEWIDTVALIRNVTEEFAQEVQILGYSVDIDIDESLPEIRADQEALARAIWNLLDNAVKYSPDCLTVGIKAYVSDKHIAIQVDDEGIGISQAEQERIFEKFFRAGTAKSNKIPGTGLGLAMVKHIVTGHGGQLHIESKLGAGSTFRIKLPAERRIG